MSEEQQDKPKGRVRRLFRLRVPKVRRGSIRINEEYAKLKRGIAETRHLCPHDGTPMRLEDVFETQEDGTIPEGAEPYRALVCPECGFTVPVSAVKDMLKEEAEPLLKTSNQFVLFAVVIFVLLSAISFMNGNILTFLGGAIMTLMLFISAMFYRYRHWQAVSGNLFLDSPPVSQWLREEILGRDARP